MYFLKASRRRRKLLMSQIKSKSSIKFQKQALEKKIVYNLKKVRNEEDDEFADINFKMRKKSEKAREMISY